MEIIIPLAIAGIAGVSFHLGQFFGGGREDAKYWSTMYKICSESRHELEVENAEIRQELEACWKCINARSNKGHWTKQKRVKGRFSK